MILSLHIARSSSPVGRGGEGTRCFDKNDGAVGSGGGGGNRGSVCCGGGAAGGGGAESVGGGAESIGGGTGRAGRSMGGVTKDGKVGSLGETGF